MSTESSTQQGDVDPSIFRTLVEISFDGVAIHSDGIYRYLNPAAARILGAKSPEELIGTPMLNVIHPGQREAVAARVRAATLEGQRLPPMEQRLIRLDGSEAYVESEGMPTTWVGRPAVVAHFIDITERKRIQAELQAAEERFRIAASVVNDTIWEWDIAKGDHCRYTGHQSVLGHALGAHVPDIAKWRALVHPEDVDRVIKSLEDALHSDAALWTAEYRFRRVDGTYAYVVDRAHIVRNSAGEPVRVVGAMIDTTSRRLAVEELVRSYRMLRKGMVSTIEAMARAVEMRDPYTAGHQRRVADLACAIATEMGLAAETVEGIRLAALVHDVGKIAIPGQFLTKPGALTETEFRIVQTHPEVGYEILSPIELSWPIARIALEHHEPVNGSGYPRGLKKNEVLLESRIVAVADVVEAMASHRPYRPRVGLDKALAEIASHSGELYDEDVVAACLSLFQNKHWSFGKDVLEA